MAMSRPYASWTRSAAVRHLRTNRSGDTVSPPPPLLPLPLSQPVLCFTDATSNRVAGWTRKAATAKMVQIVMVQTVPHGHLPETSSAVRFHRNPTSRKVGSSVTDSGPARQSFLAATLRRHSPVQLNSAYDRLRISRDADQRSELISILVPIPMWI